MVPTSLVFALASVALFLAGAACASDPVVDRGFAHTQVGRKVVERSISRVGRLVGSGGPLLVPSWNMPSNADVVTVYLVEGRPGAFVTPAAVPRGCRCIFVSPLVLDEWIQRNSSGAGRMLLDTGNFLVFVLLHEVGHLKNSTPGAAFRDGILSQLNIDPSRAKAAEEEADNFAADLLKSRATQPDVDDVSLDANWVVTELTKLSWNMQALRTLDEFGAFSVGKASVFFDNGYTHPNLAWRILRVNDRIQQTEQTRYLLQVFEEVRQRGADPQPLYRRQ